MSTEGERRRVGEREREEAGRVNGIINAEAKTARPRSISTSAGSSTGSSLLQCRRTRPDRCSVAMGAGGDVMGTGVINGG